VQTSSSGPWLKRVLATFVLGLYVFACGGSSSSPTTNTPTPTPAATTRIIGLSGNLVFGNVTIGQNATGTLTITNAGNAALTVSGMTVPSGSGSVYASSFTSGTIAAGGSQLATIQFAPTAATTYSGTLTVNGDQTSGTNTISISGTGITPTPTTFSLNGTVTDGTSHGILPNITVQIVFGTNVGKSAVTDGSGSYSMGGLSAGTFTLSAAATSYLTTTQPVTLSASTRVDLVLQRAATPVPTPTPTRTRVGATCSDGWVSTATGSGACSSHGGVSCWRYNDGTCTNP
jgi:hypothetical protein